MEPSRILIVEDEAIVAMDLEDRLVSMGYQVVGRAATGEQAVDLARRVSPDLLLMDIRLQGPMDGIVAAVEIRRHRRIPVIFVSAYADGATLERAKDAEPYGFVVKPFDDRELHSAIEVAMYRARSEDKILRLTRLYAVLSQINQAVVRITDSGELFAAVCRIVVEYGDVDLAWVGRLDEEAKRIVPLARFGRHHAYLDAAFAETGDERKRLVSAHKAIEEGRPIVCADCGSEGICDVPPSKAPHDFGYRSCLSVPLIAQGWGHGVLCVMATEPSFFGQQEIDLFKEVALDVSFALDHLAKEDERHRANEALEAEVTRRRVLIEGSRDGIVVIDENGKTLECNPRFAEMLGCSPDDVLEMHVWDWDAAFSREKIEDMIRHISPNGDHFETRHRRTDGSLLDVDIVTNMAVVGGQKLIFCVCRDITTRKRAELELLQSEERFRTLVETAPEPVFVQTDGKFAYLNPAAHHLFGLEDGDELLGESVVEYFHPDSRKSVELRLQTLQQERKSVPRVAEKIVRLDGRVMDVEVSAAPFVYDGKEGAVVFAHDITARRQAEHALDRQRAMLQAVVDHMPAGLAMYEGDPLRPILSNRQADRLLGRDLPDRIAQGQLAEYFQVFLAGTNEPYPTERMPVVRAFGGEVSTIDDMEILQPDGTRVHLEVRGTPIRDAEGRIVASLSIFQDITERKRAEKALRDSEARFRMLFEEATEGIVLADSETGEILDCNRAFEDLSEYRREELLGRPQAMLHAPEELDGQFSKTFMAHRGPRLGEILMSELLTKSGACKTVEIKANVLKIGSRNVLQGFFRDVTEHVRHRREREMTLELLRLLNQENSLEALLEQVTRYLQEWTRCEAVGIRLKEGSDFPYFVTRGLDREFVRLEMSLCARDAQDDVLMDDDGAVLECMCGRVLRGETRAQAPQFTPKGSFWSADLQELVARAARYNPAALDGLRHRCIHEGFRSVALVPLHHGNSTIGLIQIIDHAPNRLSLELISFLENVADQVAMAVSQRQSQESLRLSEQRLRDISDAAGEFIWELDPESHIVYVSDRVEAVVGYRPDELTGRYLYDLVPRGAHTQVQDLLAECAKKPQSQVTFEAPALAKNGRTVWLQITAKSVMDALGEVKAFRGAALDITEKKQAQEERERLEAQLFQAQKMESIGRLAGGVAHDFNNMLCVITGNTQLAMSSLEPDHPLVQELADIQEAARRSADLTRQLLAFARKQTVSPKPLDLNDTIGGMTKMLRRLIGEDIDLVWTPGNALWRVYVDPAQIDQLLANLVVNARDAIPGTGAIVLHTANERLEAMDGEPDFVPGDYVMLSIRDTGVGMSNDVLERIFEPFFTTKELGKGTGLGLATVYGILKQNNGFIRVSSQINQGSTFRIYLPRFDAVEESEEGEMDARQLPHGEETILLVEDELPVLKLGARILSRLGYTVLEAQDPRRALETARDHAGEIHLVLTDVVMPDLNGRELVEQVRALRPDVKCLYMSGYTADVIAHRGVLEDGLTFLQKPFTMSDLAERVRRALDSAE